MAHKASTPMKIQTKYCVKPESEGSPPHAHNAQSQRYKSISRESSRNSIDENRVGFRFDSVMENST